MQKLCHVGKGKSCGCSQTAGEPAVSPSSYSWFLQRYPWFFPSFFVSLAHGLLHCCSYSQKNHIWLLSMLGHPLWWRSMAWHEQTLSGQLLVEKKNQNTKTQPIKKTNKAKQINKKQRNKKKADFWAGMVSCISLAILYLTRAIKGGLVCDLISTTSGMIPLESLKIPLMPPEEKAAIASKPVSHQKGW